MPPQVDDPPYAIVVRNAALQRVGKLDRLISLEITPKYCDVGSWELQIPIGSQADLLTRTGGIIVHSGDESGPAIMSGPVHRFDRVINEQNPEPGTLKVTGFSDDDVVARALAYQVPGSAAPSQAASEYDRRGSAAAETVIKGYVGANLGPTAPVARRVAGLTIEADGARGSNVKGSARMTRMLDLINPLALSGGIGWRVIQVGSVLQFQVFVPTDKTTSARFSFDLRNLIDASQYEQGPETTAAIVAGGGEGTARTFREIVDSTAQTNWGRRREVFIDRRDTTDTVELDQAGTEAIVDGGPQTGLSIVTTDIPNQAFGVHYGLGDRVTVEAFGVVQDVLRELKLTWSADTGPKTTSSVGTNATTGTPRYITRLKQLTAAVAALQARK